MKNKTISIILILSIIIISFLLLNKFNSKKTSDLAVKDNNNIVATETNDSLKSNEQDLSKTNTKSEEVGDKKITKQKPIEQTVIGKSVSGKDIVAYRFGTGPDKLLFIGGVHGGYSVGTVDLSYKTIEYLTENLTNIPKNLTVTVIPALNQDGLKKTTGIEGRFNANNVDLNRNFDCNWSATSKWRDKTVSGGSKEFSEPEAAALRDFVLSYQPKAAVVWFAAEGKVYPASCGEDYGEETLNLTKIFAEASGYKTGDTFNAYDITGDMVDWMTDEGITAISVLLSEHNKPEWNKNKAGIEAVINYYSNKSAN